MHYIKAALKENSLGLGKKRENRQSTRRNTETDKDGEKIGTADDQKVQPNTKAVITFHFHGSLIKTPSFFFLSSLYITVHLQ